MSKSKASPGSTGVPVAAFQRVEKNGDVLIDVHGVPNAAKTQLAGLHGDPGQLGCAFGCTRRRSMARPDLDSASHDSDAKTL